MFSSLDRVDIVLKADAAGRQQFVQTDHRTAEEVAAEPELSVVFAILRVLNPRRMAEAGSPEPLVRYSARERPPEFLRRAIHAAGGQLVVGDNFEPEPMTEEPPPLEDLLQSAFADLARAVAAEFQVALTSDGLRAVEEQLAVEAGDPEEDEITYWSAVLKLGCLGGELIRAANGGRWIATDSGSLPVSLETTFRGGEATVNPLGKAIKRFANGEEDSLVALVAMLIGQR